MDRVTPKSTAQQRPLVIESSERTSRKELAKLSYDGSGRVSIDIDHLSLSVEPVLNNFEPDPRFLDLIGASKRQQEEIRELLLEEKSKQDNFESNSFRIVDQQAGNATFIVENSIESAMAARSKLETSLRRILGENNAQLFIKASKNFLERNALYTDNVKIYNVTELAPDLANLAGTTRSISVSTLDRRNISEGASIDSRYIESARQNNLISVGEVYFTKDVPTKMLHLIEQAE